MAVVRDMSQLSIYINTYGCDALAIIRYLSHRSNVIEHSRSKAPPNNILRFPPPYSSLWDPRVSDVESVYNMFKEYCVETAAYDKTVSYMYMVEESVTNDFEKWAIYAGRQIDNKVRWWW